MTIFPNNFSNFSFCYETGRHIIGYKSLRHARLCLFGEKCFWLRINLGGKGIIDIMIGIPKGKYSFSKLINKLEKKWDKRGEILYEKSFHGIL